MDSNLFQIKQRRSQSHNVTVPRSPSLRNLLLDQKASSCLFRISFDSYLSYVLLHSKNKKESEVIMLKEFKEFAVKGNVVDMAVGIIIGASFGSIVKSLVDDVIMPPIGLILGNVDFSNLYLVLKPGTTPGPYASFAEAKKAGAVAIGYGAFINTIVSFLIVAFAVFLLVRAVNRLKQHHEVAPAAAPVDETKVCPQCVSKIHINAKKCPFCTSPL